MGGSPAGVPSLSSSSSLPSRLSPAFLARPAVLVFPVVRLLGLGLPARLHVLPETFPAALAAEAALAIAAEAGGGVEEVRAVDPHGAGLDLGGEVQGEVDVLRPEARRQAVARVVHQLDGLLR